MIYVPYDFIICDYNLTTAKNTHDKALRKVFNTFRRILHKIAKCKQADILISKNQVV